MARILRTLYRHVAVWHGLAISTPKTVGLVVFFLVLNLLPFFPFARTARAEFSLSGGYFFTEAGEKGDSGFAITDDAGVPMWREYTRLGGPGALGYPISWRYVGNDGLTYQATQGALLQWDAMEQRVVVANAVDMITYAGKDTVLAAKGIPPAILDDGSGGDEQKARVTRLSWLTDEAIRNYYFANPNPKQNVSWDESAAIDLYGLPTSRPQSAGPYVVQRFQKAVLQLWVDRVPGMPQPGTVVRVLVGDLAKEAGLVPGDSTKALTPDSPMLRADPGLREPIRILESSLSDRRVAAAISEYRVNVVFANLDDQTVAHFLPGRRTVEVNRQWQGADARTLAAVLSHEATHVADYFGGVKTDNPEACYASEQRAFTVEAQFWQAMYGQRGKQPSGDDLDRQLNIVQSAVSDAEGFATQIRTLYQKQCGG